MTSNGASTDPTTQQLSRHLAAELRLPLAALGRLAARCAASKNGEMMAIGRAVGRECERLDILVANTFELGLVPPEPPAGRTDLLDVVEKAVAGHRVLVEGLAIRVRVLESTRQALVAGARAELLECFAALFSDLLERVPGRGQIEVRVRDVVGRVRVDCTSASAAPPLQADRPAMTRARALLEGLRGEVWEICDDERGFGFTLPQLRVPAAEPA